VLYARLPVSKPFSTINSFKIQKRRSYRASLQLSINVVYNKFTKLQNGTKANFKYIPKNKMLKPWINNCRDDLYGRLMVLNTFQQSIRLIMFQTSIQTTVETCYMHVSWFNRSKKIYELNFFCRDDLYGRLMVLNTFQQSIRLIMFQTPIQKTVETCYMHVSWFNRSKKIYELNFFCRDDLYGRLMV